MTHYGGIYDADWLVGSQRGLSPQDPPLDVEGSSVSEAERLRFPVVARQA